jgi:hypothetical protein
MAMSRLRIPTTLSVEYRADKQRFIPSHVIHRYNPPSLHLPIIHFLNVDTASTGVTSILRTSTRRP